MALVIILMPGHAERSERSRTGANTRFLEPYRAQIVDDGNVLRGLQGDATWERCRPVCDGDLYSPRTARVEDMSALIVTAGHIVVGIQAAVRVLDRVNPAADLLAHRVYRQVSRPRSEVVRLSIPIRGTWCRIQLLNLDPLASRRVDVVGMVRSGNNVPLDLLGHRSRTAAFHVARIAGVHGRVVVLESIDRIRRWGVGHGHIMP